MPTVAIRQVQIQSVVAVKTTEGCHGLHNIKKRALREKKALTGVRRHYLVSPGATAVSEGITRNICECETNHKGPTDDQTTSQTTKRLLVLSTVSSPPPFEGEQINPSIGD